MDLDQHLAFGRNRVIDLVDLQGLGPVELDYLSYWCTQCARGEPRSRTTCRGGRRSGMRSFALAGLVNGIARVVGKEPVFTNGELLITESAVAVVP
jgi:hypothetical protein